MKRTPSNILWEGCTSMLVNWWRMAALPGMCWVFRNATKWVVQFIVPEAGKGTFLRHPSETAKEHEDKFWDAIFLYCVFGALLIFALFQWILFWAGALT